MCPFTSKDAYRQLIFKQHWGYQSQLPILPQQSNIHLFLIPQNLSCPSVSIRIGSRTLHKYQKSIDTQVLNIQWCAAIIQSALFICRLLITDGKLYNIYFKKIYINCTVYRGMYRNSEHYIIVYYLCIFLKYICLCVMLTQQYSDTTMLTISKAHTSQFKYKVLEVKN